MPDFGTTLLFAGAALALLVVPGPAVLYIVTRSIEQGRTAGLVSMLGIQVGGLVHVAAAAVGLSALLVQSSVAFAAVKYAGAAYLVYLGIRRFRARDEAGVPTGRSPRSAGRLFRQGVVVNTLNPKTALFFFAFLPQFVDPRAGSPAAQMAFLGLLFIAIAVVSDGAYAVAAGTVGERLRSSARYLRAERWVTGSVFVGLGTTAALTGHERA